MTKPRLGWPLALLGTIAILLLINPVGYMGGGWDDWQYLNAARCWVENGPCLPHDHWQGRWPVIAPLASSIALFGLNRLAVGLPYLVMFGVMIAMIVPLGNRFGSNPIGWITATFFAAIPYVAIQYVQPNAEFPEMIFLLGTALLVLRYADTKAEIWAMLAGISFGLSMQVRETAVIALPILLIAGWRASGGNWRHLALAAAGTALPFLIEFAWFGLSQGDPLYRRMLSLAHTQIPSTELRGGVSSGGPPFFNTELIANWRHAPGFHVHWAIDGLVNLFLNGRAGLSLWFNLLLAPVAWKKLTPPEKRAAKGAILIGTYWALMLIYVFAVDPKPRMLFMTLLMSNFVFALQLCALWRHGMKLVVALVTGLTLAISAMAHAMQYELHSAEPVVEQLIRAHPGQIETDENSRRHLILADGVEGLPPLGSGRRYLLVKLDVTCDQWVTYYYPGAFELVRNVNMSIFEKHLLGTGGTICLLAYREPLDPDDIRSNIMPEPDDRDPFKIVKKMSARSEER